RSRALIRNANGGVSKFRELGQRLAKVCPARKIAPGDAHHLPPPPATQRCEEFGIGGRSCRADFGDERGPSRRVLRRPESVVKLATLDQRDEQRGMSCQRLSHEVATREEKRQRVTHWRRRRGQRGSGISVGIQCFERALNER